MADGTIDSLSIEIGASASEAVKKITDVAKALKEVKKAQASTASAKTAQLFQGMTVSATAAMSKLDLLRKKYKASLADFEKKLSLGKLDDKGIANAALQLKNIQAQIDKATLSEAKAAQKEVKTSEAVPVASNQATGFVAGLKAGSAETVKLNKELDRIGNIMKSSIGPIAKMMASAFKQAAGYAKRIAKDITSVAGKTLKGIWDKSAFAGLEKSLGRIKHVIASFERIAFYRAIRSAIKYVTDALKEGVENAYHYADEFGTATHYIAEAYDRISGSNFTMSNQLGAAWATMIAYIEPIIIRLINLVTRAADAVTQFFALLSGKGTYLKAVDYNKKWADSAGSAAKAAKEWKNQLMGFDEINRLEEPSDGSGGGGGANTPDYSRMFQEMPVNDFFAEIRRAFENGEWAKLGTLLGQKFNEIVDSIKWAEYGQRIGRGLQASITTAYTFLKTADFRNLGSRISEFVNNAMDQVNFTRLGRLWMRLRTALWDVVYGAVINLNWKTVAEKLSDFMLGALNELSDWLKKLEPDKIAQALKDFFGNIKYEEIGEKLKEVVKQALGVLGDTVWELLPENLGDEFRDGIADAIKKADFAAIHNVLSYKLDEAVFGEKAAKAMWYAKGEYAGRDLVLGTEYGIQRRANEFDSTLKSYITDPVSQTLYEMEQSGVTAGTNLTNEMSAMASKAGSSMDDLKNSSAGVSESMWSLSIDGGTAMDDLRGAIEGVSGAAWDMASDGSGAMRELDGAVYNNGQNMVTNLNTIRDAALEVWSVLRELGDKGQARIDANGGIWASLGGFATGGFPEDGLFMANHGELVGRFSNGRTAVANNEMIVEGISAGVFNAVVSAFSQTGGGNGSGQPVNIYLDGRQIAQTTTKYQTQFARASGA